MRDILFVALTSEGCGHCSHMRGDGTLGNGKQFNTYKFLNQHVDPEEDGKGITCLNIHFRDMGGRHQTINEIVKYKKSGKNEIIYEKYYQENGMTHVDVMRIDSSEKVRKIISKRVKIEGKDIIWLDFLDRKVPKKIENYTYFYPCFVIFKKEEWKQGGNILGLTNAGYTIREKSGDYAIEKNPQTLQQRNIPPTDLIMSVMKGVTKFKTHRDDFQGEKNVPTEVVKEEKNVPTEVVKEEKEVPDEDEFKIGRFVIKAYDDE